MKLNGFLAVIMACLCASFMSSCTEDGNPIFTDNNSVSNTPKLSTGITLFALPSGWSTVSTGSGTALYRKGSENTYVVKADLKVGAKVGMVYDTPSGQSSTGAIFNRKSISTWNTYGTFFAIANSSFFDNTIPTGSTCTIPFPLRQNYIFESYGTGGSSSDQSKPKSTLNIYADYADIVDIGTTSLNYTLMSYAPKAYAGFKGSTSNANSATVSDGRTLVGLKDDDGDGKLELVYLLVAISKNQTQAYNILTQDFGCSKVITFDGGGSSQLICNGSSKVSQSRTLPVCIVIKENGI